MSSMSPVPGVGIWLLRCVCRRPRALPVVGRRMRGAGNIPVSCPPPRGWKIGFGLSSEMGSGLSGLSSCWSDMDCWSNDIEARRSSIVLSSGLGSCPMLARPFLELVGGIVMGVLPRTSPLLRSSRLIASPVSIIRFLQLCMRDNASRHLASIFSHPSLNLTISSSLIWTSSSETNDGFVSSERSWVKISVMLDSRTVNGMVLNCETILSLVPSSAALPSGIPCKSRSVEIVYCTRVLRA